MSLQSHAEVLSSLDSSPSLDPHRLRGQLLDNARNELDGSDKMAIDVSDEGKVFVASISPQVRASLAAAYNVSEVEAGWMIDHLLRGPQGIASGGKYGNSFTWVVDTNAMREAALVLGADEIQSSPHNLDFPVAATEQCATIAQPKYPIVSSACPGWICYIEKTHSHVLSHLSRLKSPQALTGTLLKTVLSTQLHLRPDQIWHVAVMPCFDKKLEASREELTDVRWRPPSAPTSPVRDVDCVITSRELLMLASTRGINFSSLPRHSLPSSSLIPFPDPAVSAFLFSHRGKFRKQNQKAGTSGGYLHHVLATQQSLHPASSLTITRGRNADVIEYTLRAPDATPLFSAARYYGFHNIQNLVRKLRPPKTSRLPGARPATTRGASGSRRLDYAYVEVMACPGGCTNGGGQLRAQDAAAEAASSVALDMGPKQWLAKVDEAYFSMDDEDREDEAHARRDPGTDMDTDSRCEENDEPDINLINGISPSRVRTFLHYWATSTGIPLQKLVTTTYRAVESDVGKKPKNMGQTERLAQIAAKVGGGW